MKSIKRTQRVTSIIILLFILGMVVLVLKIIHESSFYMMNSDKLQLGYVYDRKGDVLFDGTGNGSYPDNHFLDVGNIIGDDKGQMENTIVACNLEKLNNYNFSDGLLKKGGKAAIYTTLDHATNRAVFDAYGYMEGCVTAYNYKTGEMLVCASLPSLDVTKGYENINSFEDGTLWSKTLHKTVPGSTQKVSTVISALEIMGSGLLYSKSYTCNGKYINQTGGNIDCHNAYGHGTQNIQQAFENSCNPFFAQLIEDNDLPFERLKKQYEKLGYVLNGAKSKYIDIDGIQCETASTTLENPYEFKTQWGCIGQGDTLVSPIQLMMWESAIANGSGKMTMPYFIDHVTNTRGSVKDKAKTKYSDKIFSESTASAVKQIMLTNGSDKYSYLISGYPVGVKSGTAQVQEGAKENSLLVGFVDDPSFPIAFCILIEDKDSGWITTEYIAQILLDNLKNNI
ncbi:MULTISPECIES: penicillin-binding transpeptidase domain-containing protein [Ruminococcus]|uniref:Penicillin binding protein transpeptidase domain-containing protein n=1 Tax=Ruminococcus flavefaciens TaxID=1265 RepID=A0A1M7HC09_RUMFL|nr:MULTISPECIES: penicillin-binding transpeptidase domain-containing protein [Ruminococcus]MCR4795362.1 ABC transporter permease [Ruminococcus sp.]SHM25958.1 Penicillin binding protein transpeptidase domain-containing protein [Ruminococcus flavefaciens]